MKYEPSDCSPEQIAKAWATWKSRNPQRLGPGPCFVEAINAAMSLVPKTKAIPRGFTRAQLEEMLDCIKDNEQTVDAGHGPQESTDSFFARLLRALLTAPEEDREKRLETVYAAALDDIEEMTIFWSQERDRRVLAEKENEILRQKVRSLQACLAPEQIAALEAAGFGQGQAAEEEPNPVLAVLETPELVDALAKRWAARSAKYADIEWHHLPAEGLDAIEIGRDAARWIIQAVNAEVTMPLVPVGKVFYLDDPVTGVFTVEQFEDTSVEPNTILYAASSRTENKGA